MDERATHRRGIRGDKRLTLELDEFAWRTIAGESAQLGVAVEELAVFAILYYLADLDSGRVARRIPTVEGQGSSGLG